MKNVIVSGSKITDVRMCIEIDYEYGMGGSTSIVHLGESLHIETKYGTIYDGIILGYEESKQEGIQDYFVIFDTNGKKKNVGVNDIVIMEKIV